MAEQAAKVTQARFRTPRLLFRLAAACAVVAIACAILGTWIGEDRWIDTGGILFGPALVLPLIAAVLAAREAGKQRG